MTDEQERCRHLVTEYQGRDDEGQDVYYCVLNDHYFVISPES